MNNNKNLSNKKSFFRKINKLNLSYQGGHLKMNNNDFYY